MSIFKNQSCPVCARPFEEGEDIVVCPVCGTPCHRACYNKTGACPNQALHAQGFSYAEAAESPAAEKKAQSGQGGMAKCEQCGAEIRRGAIFCTKCGARQRGNLSGSYSPDSGLIVPAPDIKYERSSEKLDGVPLADAATVVGTRCEKFIDKFIKNKKASWNWSAFFFGEYYFFYRKMTPLGVLLMIVKLIADLVTFTVFADKFAAINEIFSGISTVQEAAALSQNSAYLAAVQAALPACGMLFGCFFVIHILSALFADSAYRRRVVKIVKQVDEQMEAGNLFALGTMPLPQERINSRDVRRMLLARKGGVNIFAPVLAYFLFQIVASLLGL